MRPHTRTQCTDGKECTECSQGLYSVPVNNSSNSSQEDGGSGKSSVANQNISNKNGFSAFLAANNEGVGSSSSRHSPTSPFVAPASGPLRRSTKNANSSHNSYITGCARGASASTGTSWQTKATRVSAGKDISGNVSRSTPSANNRCILIVQLPAEILVTILNYMSFSEISKIRLVSRRFNEICASMLNTTFQRFQSHMLSRFQAIKSQMPRRESARRNHPLARECDIIETLHMRLTLLQMTFGKHIERKHLCFFAGEILDEVQRIMRYIRQTSCLVRAYKVTDELFDLSTMAMEYFKEHIEPTLPELSYFGAEFLDFDTPFATPTKRRSTSGSNVGLIGLESPGSSRASVAGSSCSSEPWSTSSTIGNADDAVDNGQSAFGGPVSCGNSYPQSNMVLRKRIRKIREGMKRYNNQLVEVKRELKSCKTKMETQTKQVQEYSLRLDEYDKKFEESSRKFQTLLTELNKCKTELQYWRSKSMTLLSLPSTCSSCEAPLTSLKDFTDGEASSNDLKALANQGIFPSLFASFDDADLDDSNLDSAVSGEVQRKPSSENPPTSVASAATTRHSQAVKNGGPLSPTVVGANNRGGGATISRKQRYRDDSNSATGVVTSADEANTPTSPVNSGGVVRKSLRGGGVKSTRGKKRQKLASPSH